MIETIQTHLGIPLLTIIVIIVILPFIVARRIRKKKAENFENRDN